MSEIETYREQSPLAVQIEYASRVSSASMLPDNYRNKPADIMLAIGLGQSMGLSPAESLYRISVIKGKPTASAELIAANVRKAGHRLRVLGDETSATCVIVRADDPDFEFSVTRDLEWAARMGLASNDNYRKQAGTMLQWRAISACARLACPEALYGVSYTPDEMGDMPTAPRTGGGLGAALRVEQVQTESGAAGSVPSPEATPDEVAPSPTSAPDSPYLNTSGGLAKTMFGLMGDLSITARDDRLLYASDVLGRQIGSSKEMTDADAEQVVEALRAELDKQNAAAGDVVDGEVSE